MSSYQQNRRVEIAPHTDRWMRGDRYGTIVAVTEARIKVKFDKSGQTVKFLLNDSIDNLLTLID